MHIPKMIYFDHNATTPPDKQVVEAMLPYLTTFYGNPSSLYRSGRATRSAIETARKQVANLVDTHPDQVIFTSGGTEANNLALNTVPIHSKMAVSTIEHPSIIEPAKKISQKNLTLIPVEKNGTVLPSTIKTLYQQINTPALISVMLANNENGTIQQIKKIAHSLKNKSCLFHTDAIQAIGKIPVSFNQLGVNLMSLSSHKIYGPKGSGALIIDNSVTVNPLLVGGGQENNFRSGTENVAAIVGFGKAAELALQRMKHNANHALSLRRLLEHELKSISGLVIFAEQTERLPNTVQFGVDGIDGEMLLMQLDMENVAVSSGSACKSAAETSPVLTAMKIDHSLAKSAIRISLGKDNTENEILKFVEILKHLVEKIR